MIIEKIASTKLNPAPYNPRKDLKPGDPEYEKLRRSIGEFGYVEPIVWNKQTGNIVGGHQRFKVLRDLGYTDVDCVVVDIDEVQEKALNVAMNKISGAWNESKLTDLLGELDAADFDVSLTGFDAADLEALFKIMAGAHKTSCWFIDKPLKSKLHPTMKPIALIANALLNSSERGDVVLDAFGGSGSTLIACEQLDRQCYMMELDPKYCDVIALRYAELKKNGGVDITCERDGKTLRYSDLMGNAADV